MRTARALREGLSKYRVLAAVAVFAGVFAAHAYLSMYPAPDPEVARWAALPDPLPERAGRYVASGGVWLGYSYAVSAAFVAAWLFAPRRWALGGMTLSGALGASACFLVGCCGSPMLGVWIALFGAAAAPWLGPAAALFTTLSLAAAWLWMRKRQHGACACRRFPEPDGESSRES